MYTGTKVAGCTPVQRWLDAHRHKGGCMHTGTKVAVCTPIQRWLDAHWYKGGWMHTGTKVAVCTPVRRLDAHRYTVPVPLQNWIISPSRDAGSDSGTIPNGTGRLYSGSKGCRSVSLIIHSHLVLSIRLRLCSCSMHGCSPVDVRAFAILTLGQ
jgi:hypothetical protein